MYGTEIYIITIKDGMTITDFIEIKKGIIQIPDLKRIVIQSGEIILRTETVKAEFIPCIAGKRSVLMNRYFQYTLDLSQVLCSM